MDAPRPTSDLAADVPAKPNRDLAAAFHEAYERLAPDYGYETRKESAVSWEEVPENNRRLMEAVVAEVVGPLVARITDLEAECARRSDEILAYHNAKVAAEAQVAAWSKTAHTTEATAKAQRLRAEAAEAQVAALTLAAGETDGAGSTDAAAVTSPAASNIEALRRCLKNPTLIYSTKAEEKLDALAAQVAALTQERDEYAERLAWHRDERDAYLKGNLWVWRAADEQRRAVAAEAALATTRQALTDYCDECDAHGGLPSTVTLRALAATEPE